MVISFFIATILSHALVMCLFLTIFFFTVARKVETQIVEEQVKLLVDNLSMYIIPLLSKEDKETLLQKLKTIPLDTFKSADKQVADSNNNIIKKAIIGTGIIVGISLVLIIGLWLYGSKFNTVPWGNGIMGLTKDNIIILFFIAGIEFLFLYTIAKNYFSVDPNSIKLKILETISK